MGSVTYDAEKSILYLRFRSGEVFRYFDLPTGHYEQFLRAESRGRYFRAHIRNQTGTNDLPGFFSLHTFDLFPEKQATRSANIGSSNSS